jgi:hypothetical protein
MSAVTGQLIWCYRGMAITAVPAMPRGEAAESLAVGTLDWLLGSARSTKEGLTWAATVPGGGGLHVIPRLGGDRADATGGPAALRR